MMQVYKKRKVGGRIILEPTNPEEVFANLNQEIMATVRFLNWLCKETYDFYIQTESFKKLQNLIKPESIEKFRL